VRVLSLVVLLVLIVVLGYAVDVVMTGSEVILATVNQSLISVSSALLGRETRVEPLFSSRVGGYPFAALALLAIGVIALIIITLLYSIRGGEERGGAGSVYVVR